MGNAAFIIELIKAGEALEDVAETCGHDDSLDEWKKTKEKALKSLNPVFVSKYFEIKEEEKLAQKEKSKNSFLLEEELFLEKRKKEEAELLKSFGLGLSADGKITGL